MVDEVIRPDEGVALVERRSAEEITEGFVVVIDVVTSEGEQRTVGCTGINTLAWYLSDRRAAVLLTGDYGVDSTYQLANYDLS